MSNPKKLSHFNASGQATMVDVSEKEVTRREAIARGEILMQPETIALLARKALPKGDGLEAARLAGILAAKKTGELIPLCHPLGLDYVDVQINVQPDRLALEATARCTGRTGVEMEALTAVAVAGLTLYEKVRGGAPVCYGSRFMGDNRRLHGRSTYWANRMLNMTCNLVNGIRLTDMNTCYKMMRADVARRLHLQSRGFAMEPEITTKLARLKVPIEELPISYIPREKSEGKKIRAMDFFRYLRAMGRYRFSSFDTGSADVQPPAQGSSSHPA